MAGNGARGTWGSSLRLAGVTSLNARRTAHHEVVSCLLRIGGRSERGVGQDDRSSSKAIARGVPRHALALGREAKAGALA